MRTVSAARILSFGQFGVSDGKTWIFQTQSLSITGAKAKIGMQAHFSRFQVQLDFSA